MNYVKKEVKDVGLEVGDIIETGVQTKSRRLVVIDQDTKLYRLLDIEDMKVLLTSFKNVGEIYSAYEGFSSFRIIKEKNLKIVEGED